MKNKILNEVKALWQLAWPVLIGQLATVGMSVSDVAMTGHYSADDLAAVALGASLWAIVLVTVMGIMIAINAVVAHEVGAENFSKVPHIMRQSLWMAGGIGLLAALALNYATCIFDYLHIEDNIHLKATQFVNTISFGMPAFALYRALYSYTTSLNHTKPIMMIALGGLAYNILANWILIYGNFGLPAFGGIGCAIATASGLWLMLAAMCWWMKHSPVYRETYPFTHWEWPHWPEIKSTLRIGLPIGITYFAEVSAFCAVGLLVARFGVEQVSANQIALNFSSVVFMVPMSIGIALTSRVSQSLGEGSPEKARFVAWVGIGMALTFAVISACFITLFRHQVAAAYTTDMSVQDVAAILLLFAAIFQLPDAVQVTTSCAIRGYKVTRPPMIIQLMAFYGFALPIGCALGLAPEWLIWKPAKAMAASGFWIALVLGLTVAALLLSLYLYKLGASKVRMTASSGKIAG